MHRLYDETVHTVTTYQYKINTYGISSEPELCNCGYIRIIFVNGIFDRAEFPFSNPYTKNQWEVLSAINEKIQELTKE